MPIRLKRAYEPPASSDGRRILVERLWPRGVARSEARIDFWSKETAPSPELRRWFGHDPQRWCEFKQRYFAELRASSEPVGVLRRQLGGAGSVTFVYASRETRFNSAVALREYITEVDP